MQKHLPVFDFLDEHKVVYKRETFPDTTEKGAANVAHALGFRERQMVKTLVFETDKNECALIMVGGDQNAISGHLKKVLGSRNISMCSPEKVKTVTGYVIGSIPPFHWQPEGFKTFLEESLCSEETLGVGTGCWGEEILITPDELIKASKAIVVNLTDRERPIFPE
jgi:Cys-tRNA(Pro)/Cys-tRNA(Cys) deacylase